MHGHWATGDACMILVPCTAARAVTKLLHIQYEVYGSVNNDRQVGNDIEQKCRRCVRRECLLSECHNYSVVRKLCVACTPQVSHETREDSEQAIDAFMVRLCSAPSFRIRYYCGN